MSSASSKAFAPVLAARDEIERYLKELLGVGADTVQSLISDADGGDTAAVRANDAPSGLVFAGWHGATKSRRS